MERRIQGAEVAKGASEMVFTHDNFASVIKVVEIGRVIYAGIQKFVTFIISRVEPKNGDDRVED